MSKLNGFKSLNTKQLSRTHGGYNSLTGGIGRGVGTFVHYAPGTAWKYAKWGLKHLRR